jgi:hypothetical protein
VAFSQSTISDLTLSRSGVELLIAWSSSSPNGVFYQVYIGRRLAWTGTALRCLLPWPSGLGANTPIDVGTVGTSDRFTDYSGSLPATPANRVTLAWQGGTYLASDIAGFRIYASAVAGGAVSFASPIATIPAYPGGIILDGFGMGGFGQGGFGRAASTYSYTTGTYGNGVWTFAVVPYDQAGNAAGSPVTQTATIAAPPRPPAASSQGVRLTYAYNSTAHTVTLAWLASPA